MAEFFIMRKYRRAGVGTRAASEIFRQNPGQWEVPIAHYNLPALAFWEKVVSGLASAGEVSCLSGDGNRWSGAILRFRTSSR